MLKPHLQPAFQYALAHMTGRECHCGDRDDHNDCRWGDTGFLHLLGAHKPKSRLKVNCLFFRPQVRVNLKA